MSVTSQEQTTFVSVTGEEQTTSVQCELTGHVHPSVTPAKITSADNAATKNSSTICFLCYFGTVYFLGLKGEQPPDEDDS